MATGSEPAFGVRLRELRRQQGLTQRELASRVHLDFTYLSKIENGADVPGEAAVHRLADALKTDRDELLALAGKVPAEMAEWARHDPRSLRLMRKLPEMTKKQRDDIYRRAQID